MNNWQLDSEFVANVKHMTQKFTHCNASMPARQTIKYHDKGNIRGRACFAALRLEHLVPVPSDSVEQVGKLSALTNAIYNVWMYTYVVPTLSPMRI